MLRARRKSSSISPDMAAAVRSRIARGNAKSSSGSSYAVTWLAMISIVSFAASVWAGFVRTTRGAASNHTSGRITHSTKAARIQRNGNSHGQ